MDLIKSEGETSPEIAALRLGLAKTTIRQHLLTLEHQGLIRRRFERAGQGRPKIVFQLASQAQRLYPTQEPELLKALLEYLKATKNQKIIKAFFDHYWKGREGKFESILASLRGAKPVGIEMRLQALKTLLESEGFMPKVELSGNVVQVRECNCPLRETISATQYPCKLELDFIRWALKVRVERTAHLPSGGAACIYLGKVKSGC